MTAVLFFTTRNKTSLYVGLLSAFVAQNNEET